MFGGENIQNFMQKGYNYAIMRGFLYKMRDIEPKNK